MNQLLITFIEMLMRVYANNYFQERRFQGMYLCVQSESAGGLLSIKRNCSLEVIFPLTLAMLNKLRCHAHFKFQANQIT